MKIDPKFRQHLENTYKQVELDKILEIIESKFDTFDKENEKHNISSESLKVPLKCDLVKSMIISVVDDYIGKMDRSGIYK